MMLQRKLPSLEDLIRTLEVMGDLGVEPEDQHYIDSFNRLRMNSHNVETAKDVFRLIEAFMALRVDPPTPLATTLWKGILVIAAVITSRYVEQPNIVRMHLNIIYSLLDLNIISDSDFTDTEHFFSKIDQLAEITDTRWLAANIEVGFTKAGKQNYQTEFDFALDLVEVAQNYHPLLFLHSCLLIANICTKYSDLQNAFIYGQQAILLANFLNLKHLKRSGLVFMSNLAVNFDDNPYIDDIMLYWNSLHTEDDPPLEAAAIYATAWQRHYRRGDYKQAEECLTYAIDVYQSRQNLRQTLDLQISLAMVYVYQRRYEKAIELSNEVYLSAHHSKKAPIQKIRAMHVKGWALARDEQYEEALLQLRSALEAAGQLPASNQKQTFINGIKDDLAPIVDKVHPDRLNSSQIEFVLGLISVFWTQKEVENLPKWLQKRLEKG